MSIAAAVLAFLGSPAGIALIAAVPELVAEVLRTLHKSGALTAQDIIDHAAIIVPEIAPQPAKPQPGPGIGAP